jgi:hypothetical protein
MPGNGEDREILAIAVTYRNRISCVVSMEEASR